MSFIETFWDLSFIEFFYNLSFIEKLRRNQYRFWCKWASEFSACSGRMPTLKPPQWSSRQRGFSVIELQKWMWLLEKMISTWFLHGFNTEFGLASFLPTAPQLTTKITRILIWKFADYLSLTGLLRYSREFFEFPPNFYKWQVPKSFYKWQLGK